MPTRTAEPARHPASLAVCGRARRSECCRPRAAPSRPETKKRASPETGLARESSDWSFGLLRRAPGRDPAVELCLARADPFVGHLGDQGVVAAVLVDVELPVRPLLERELHVLDERLDGRVGGDELLV